MVEERKGRGGVCCVALGDLVIHLCLYHQIPKNRNFIIEPETREWLQSSVDIVFHYFRELQSAPPLSIHHRTMLISSSLSKQILLIWGKS